MIVIALANPVRSGEVSTVEFIEGMGLASKSVAVSVFLAEDDIESVTSGTASIAADLALSLSAFF